MTEEDMEPFGPMLAKVSTKSRPESEAALSKIFKAKADC